VREGGKWAWPRRGVRGEGGRGVVGWGGWRGLGGVGVLWGDEEREGVKEGRGGCRGGGGGGVWRGGGRWRKVGRWGGRGIDGERMGGFSLGRSSRDGPLMGAKKKRPDSEVEGEHSLEMKTTVRLKLRELETSGVRTEQGGATAFACRPKRRREGRAIETVFFLRSKGRGIKEGNLWIAGRKPDRSEWLVHFDSLHLAP